MKIFMKGTVYTSQSKMLCIATVVKLFFFPRYTF
jgi:hypothetical protein